MVIFYKKWKKYNEIQLTKNKMDLNNRKVTNHPPYPEELINLFLHLPSMNCLLDRKRLSKMEIKLI